MAHPMGESKDGVLRLYFRAYCARWSRSGRSDRPHRLGGWRNRISLVMFHRGVKPGQWRLFQRAVMRTQWTCPDQLDPERGPA